MGKLESSVPQIIRRIGTRGPLPKTRLKPVDAAYLAFAARHKLLDILGLAEQLGCSEPHLRNALAGRRSFPFQNVGDRLAPFVSPSTERMSASTSWSFDPGTVEYGFFRSISDDIRNTTDETYRVHVGFDRFTITASDVNLVDMLDKWDVNGAYPSHAPLRAGAHVIHLRKSKADFIAPEKKYTRYHHTIEMMWNGRVVARLSHERFRVRCTKHQRKRLDKCSVCKASGRACPPAHKRIHDPLPERRCGSCAFPRTTWFSCKRCRTMNACSACAEATKLAGVVKLEVHGLAWQADLARHILTDWFAPFVAANTLIVRAIDFAIDVELPFDALVVVPPKSSAIPYRRVTAHLSSGYRTTGYTFGSGDRRVIVYDKLEEVRANETYLAPHLHGWRNATRFEARLRSAAEPLTADTLGAFVTSAFSGWSVVDLRQWDASRPVTVLAAFAHYAGVSRSKSSVGAVERMGAVRAGPLKRRPAFIEYAIATMLKFGFAGVTAEHHASALQQAVLDEVDLCAPESAVQLQLIAEEHVELAVRTILDAFVAPRSL